MVRLASYNIRKARGLDQRRDPGRTLDVINRLDADIVVLQEADKRLGPRHPALPHAMIEGDTDFHLVEAATNGISLGAHGNAVLVRDLSWVKAVEVLDLPGLEPRGAVTVDLDIGPGLRIVATHLGLRRRDRHKQMGVLRAHCAGHAATVMAGDFNEWSRGHGFEALEDAYEILAPGRTFHARRPIAALDRFVVGQGVTYRDAGVTQEGAAKVASDHLPIWVDITAIC